ncbi:PAS domain S-box protein [Brevibacillus sp. SAFN-007a]|uniref:PAS domain S-box protein n=1 Tax=Brevibacillus sp. SAFN-007a TaxID=3436862 RepID=UPI003F80454A
MNQWRALGSFANLSRERAKLEQAWERFVSGIGEKPAIRLLMYESWQRCLAYNIHPLRNRTEITLSREEIEAYWQNDSLQHSLKPLLLKVKDASMDAGHLATFCNAAGDIVHLDGQRSLMLKAEDMNFVVGASWAENRAGTNAIGTSLVTGRPVQVFAGEHFCQEVQKWTCAAAPIRDPATGEILGVFNLTGLWRVNHPYALSVVISAKQAVERDLRHQLERERFRLAERFAQLATTPVSSPLLVLDRGGQVIHASSMLYEQGWVDGRQHLIGAPPQACTTASKMQWEAEQRRGTWRFEQIPYRYGGKLIGFVVYAIPPGCRQPAKRETTAKPAVPDHGLAAPDRPGALAPLPVKADSAFLGKEQVYRSLFEDHPAAIICYDLHGNILQANPAAERLVGYHAEDLQATNIASLIFPDSAESQLHPFHRGLMNRPQEFEIAVRHKNGHGMDVRLNNFPMYVDDEIVGFYAIAKDVTRDKQIEADLRATKEQLDLYLRNTVDSVVVLDVSFRVLKVNRAFERMFGWSEQEVIGDKLPTIPDFLLEQFHLLQQEIVENRHVTSYETVRQRKDGTLLNVSTFISPLSDAEGNVIAFVAIHRDITEHKRMEVALIEKEKQLRTFINAMPVSVCFKDGEGRWLEANDCCLRMFQLEHVPYHGKSDAELAKLSPVYREALLQCAESDKRTWEGGKPVRLEEVVRLEHGESRIFDVSKVPLFGPDGKRHALVIVSQDITEMKQTESLLRKSEKLSVVGQMAAGVAHEIYNPLTSIRGFIQFIQEGHSKQEYFQTILSELDRIQSVVNEFLVLAKPQVIHFAPRDLGPLLHQAAELLQSEALRHNVRIALETDPNMTMVNCEEKQLKQVFIHVLKNAIEAMPNGGQITIQLKRLGDALSIRIVDQGQGIGEERIQKLGEPFYTTKEKGTGLGLMITYKIIQAHQGSMKIESQPDKGTTVEITLPVYASFA